MGKAVFRRLFLLKSTLYMGKVFWVLSVVGFFYCHVLMVFLFYYTWLTVYFLIKWYSEGITITVI